MAKANNIELEIVETIPAKGVPAEYLKINKLGKVPTFVGADGYTLHEGIAIAIYSTSKLFCDLPFRSISYYYTCPPCYDEEKLSTVIPVLIIRVDFLLIRL